MRKNNNIKSLLRGLTDRVVTRRGCEITKEGEQILLNGVLIEHSEELEAELYRRRISEYHEAERTGDWTKYNKYNL